jgi:hypothetical protein
MENCKKCSFNEFLDAIQYTGILKYISAIYGIIADMYYL